LKNAQPDELFAAWLELLEGQRNTMDAEFRDIFEMGGEKGFRVILDEAVWQLREMPKAHTQLVKELATLVLLCYKKPRKQHGHRGSERARWVAIWRRKDAMD
jgi:hypothetical protein